MFYKIIIYFKDGKKYFYLKRYLEKEDGSIVDDNKVVKFS